MYSLKQEGKHRFLVDLSRNTARGQITNAQKGFFCGQAAPYGYHRMLIDEHGEHRPRVRTGEKVAKPRGWHVTLVPSDEVEKVDTVRWLFERYVNGDRGLRMLADALNTPGIAGPGGIAWWPATIREILRNEAYIGTFVWAKRRLGKYHRVAAGEIKQRTDGHGAKLNAPEERIVKESDHPALVDRALFDNAQAKLVVRKRSCS